MALLLCPPVFGLAGLALGIVNMAKGRIGHGLAQFFLAIVLGIVGMALGTMLLEAMHHRRMDDLYKGLK
jgi:hypothetical protein